jgi:hypothetical protein
MKFLVFHSLASIAIDNGAVKIILFGDSLQLMDLLPS